MAKTGEAARLQHAGVRLKDALLQLVQVVDEVVVLHVDLRLRRLLQHAHRHRHVLLKVAADGERDVAKAREDRRLDVAVELGALQVFEQQP